MATTTAHEQAIAMLGLRATPRSAIDMVPTLRKGLPSRSLERVATELGMSPIAVGGLLGIPSRTLARRLQEKRTFTPDESQRVFRLSRVLALVTSALGSVDKARHWLQTPNRVLEGQVPLELLDTDVGADAVIEEIGRIEHGVFA
jgi:putative toxin-antitoxin system antitoxin component (TIGR02293 family)